MNKIPIQRVEIARQAALQTGKMLAERFIEGNQAGKLKGDKTLVTEADHAADQLIREIILSAFPDDGILSEEGSTVYPENENVWIIDPLDGTVNFFRGIQYWGVSIAHLKNGVPRSAALYFPITDELYSAAQGTGAVYNNNPLKIERDFDLDLFPLFMHCSRMHQRYQVDLPYKKRSLGAAAYHLSLVANNTAVLAFESTVRIWDFAASWLIIKEAGGLIESFGEAPPFPANPGTDYHKIPFPIAAALSESILAEARNNIIRR
jgi:myo-inositol-1(or 4)-monophosphatase